MMETEKNFYQEGDWEKKEYTVNDLPEEAEGEAIKQFLLDLTQNKNASLLEKEFNINLDREKILNSSPEDIKEIIKGTRLEKFLDEENIFDAYEEIMQKFNEGKFPTVTVEPKYLKDIMMEGIKAEALNTYDNQKVIVGQVGREPFKGDERMVFQVDCDIDDVVPRNTGKRYDDFEYNGSVVFKDKHIPPEKIKLISLPEDMNLPEGVNLPISLSELKKYYH